MAKRTTGIDDEMADQQLLDEEALGAGSSRIPLQTEAQGNDQGLILEDDLDALDLAGDSDISDDESVAPRSLRVWVVVPRDQIKHPLEMETVPLAQFKSYIGGHIDPRQYPWVLQDEDNNFRPAPVAYYDLEYPPGATAEKKAQLRHENWKQIQDVSGVKLKSFASRDPKPLGPGDDGARYTTKNGEEHIRRWKYARTDMCGDEMPTFRITRPSSVPWKSKYIHCFSDNKKVKRRWPSQLAEKYGPENVNQKTVYCGFPTVKKLNQRGRFEADKAYADLLGLKYSYNRTLPEVVVRHKDSLISVELINDESKWQEQPRLKRLHDKLRTNPKNLTVAMLNEDGTSYVTPSFVARTQPAYYAKVKSDRQLPDGVERCDKQIEGEKSWVQEAKNVLTTTDVAKKKLEPGQTLAQKFPDIQMFSPRLKDGKPKGSLKMLYATLRDREEISQSVAKEFGIEPQPNHYEQRRDAAPTKDQALQNAYAERAGDETDSSTHSRKSMLANRSDERSQQGRHV